MQPTSSRTRSSMSRSPNPAYLVDESLPRSTSAALRAAGYSPEHVFEVGLIGHPDTCVFAHAQAHNQTIITSDIGLGNVVGTYPPRTSGSSCFDSPRRYRQTSVCVRSCRCCMTWQGKISQVPSSQRC